MNEREQKKLIELISSYKSEFCWRQLAKDFNAWKISELRDDVPNNALKKETSPWDLFVEYTKIKQPSLERKGKWEQEEDEKLDVAVSMFGDNWNEVSTFTGRSAALSSMRWTRNRSPETLRCKGNAFTEAETKKLLRVVDCYKNVDPLPWNLIASHFTNREPHQCRERYSFVCRKQAGKKSLV